MSAPIILQRKNVEFDTLVTFVVVEGKTGQKPQRLIISVQFVAKWLEEHPDKNPDGPLWAHLRQGRHENGIIRVGNSAANPPAET